MKKLLILCVAIVAILTIVGVSQQRSVASDVATGACWSCYADDYDGMHILRCYNCDYVNGKPVGEPTGECRKEN